MKTIMMEFAVVFCCFIAFAACNKPDVESDKDNKLIGDGGVRSSASVIPKSGETVAERFEAGHFNKSYYESVNKEGSGTTGTWK